MFCIECGRAFRRESDKARHKCKLEKERPVNEQAGATKCERCTRWFRSKGGLAVHHCKPREREQESDNETTVIPRLGANHQNICRVCGRAFRRQSDFKRHKCLSERRKPVEQQQGAIQCRECQRWFKSAGGLAVHNCFHCRPHAGSTVLIDSPIVCSVCDRIFRRQGDLKRHKCLSERAKPIEEQHGAVQCKICQRWLKSAGGFAVHSCV